MFEQSVFSPQNVIAERLDQGLLVTLFHRGDDLARVPAVPVWQPGLPTSVETVQAAHGDLGAKAFIHIGEALILGGADDDVVQLRIGLLMQLLLAVVLDRFA